MKKFLSLILTLALSVSLAACGGTEKAENKICESFEYSEEGLDAAAKWIALKNCEYLENN